MATRPERRITYDDYLTFPDGERWEIIDGEAYLAPSPTTRHQRIAGELYRQVANHLLEHGGGHVFIAPLDVVLDPDGDIVQPDVLFVADDTVEVVTAANVWGSPSWVIEVLSSDTARDRKLKLARYEHFAVPEYWIVDPVNDHVEVHRLREGRYGPPSTVRPPEGASPIRPDGLTIDLALVLRP